MSELRDEEVPFIADQPQGAPSRPRNSKRQRTPLPWRPFSILLLLRVSEGIASRVVSPFLPQLIRDIGITKGKDSRVGYYVGILHSVFAFTEACTAFYWSQLSDRIGRKPVLLIGLFGLSLSMFCFGLSKTFWALVVSRFLPGLLDGNVGVIKSMVIEITDPTNIALAYSILPITGALGTTVGPLIGGSLVRPAERFPKTFADSKFLKTYPYFLPCAVTAAFTTLSWFICFTFLKETKKPQMSLMQYLWGQKAKKYNPDSDSHSEEDGLLREEPALEATDTQLPFRALLTRQVLIAIGSYSMLAIVEMGFSALAPVYYAMPIELGGLNLDPPAIGTILALFGVPGGIIQCIFFAPMHDWLGAKNMFLATVSLCFPVIALFPVINAVARVHGSDYSVVWFLMGLQRFLLIFPNFAFDVAVMFVGAASPNKESIGATNGLALTAVSLMRAIAPALVNSAFSYSIEKNVMGGYLAYWVMAALVIVTLRMGTMLPKNMWRVQE